MSAEAARLDKDDALAPLRAAFALPEGLIYLDGNSLGPPTVAALARAARTADSEWAGGLIRSWNDAAWIDLPKTCGDKIAKIIGAESGEVIVCDSVSVNIFKLAAALLAQIPGAAIAVDADEFPTDGYILEGLAQMTGAALLRLQAGEVPDGPFVLVKSLVHYRTGAVADMGAFETLARERGGAVVWDLSHAAGVIDVGVEENGARYAVGCGYKFLNGGPGAPAFVFASSGENLAQPISGWMGHARPFDFAREYAPAEGAARFAAGTPPVLSMAALDTALDVFDSLDMGVIEAKARGLGEFFLAETKSLGLETISPTSVRRGGQVSLLHDHGYEIMQALIARGIIGDFRPPNLMRFGLSPLILRYSDVAKAAEALRDILKTEEWREPRFAVRRKVT